MAAGAHEGALGRATTPHGRTRDRFGRLYRATLGVAQRLDPSRLLLRRGVDTDVLLVCVYRGNRVAHVRRLLAGLPPGGTARLWSLDGDVPADLLPMTCGQGPGPRSRLLNRLLEGAPQASVIVLSDDDVRFIIGDLASLLDAGRRLGLDVFQPAHLASSFLSWRFTMRRRCTLGRTTCFVEQGPLVALTRRGQSLVLPMPEDDHMAWGIEVAWSTGAARTGTRLGIVDAVAIRHLGPPALAYDREGEEERLSARLEAEGYRSLEELMVVTDRVGLRRAMRLAR